jgi:hypothetical protein
MTNNYKQDNPDRNSIEHGAEGIGNDAFNHQLDAALAKLAASEPRAGLEDRILANLRSAPVPSPRIAWWMWPAVAAAVIVVAITGSLLWKPRTPVKNIQARTAPIVKPVLTKSIEIAEAKDLAANDTQSVSIPSPRIKHHDARRQAVAAAAKPPKLDQFPSPQPLSQEELALVKYVKQFPQDATLVAQAQEQYAKEIEKKMREPKFEILPSDSYRPDSQQE